MRWAGLIVAGVMLAAPAIAQEAAKTTTSAEFQAARGGATLFDVREPAEWAETGLPEGAKGVSISDAAFVEKVLAQVGGDKSKPVAVICKSGVRSARAAGKLAEAGFTSITNVGDGMNGWQAAKLPTTPYAKP